MFPSVEVFATDLNGLINLKRCTRAVYSIYPEQLDKNIFTQKLIFENETIFIIKPITAIIIITTIKRITMKRQWRNDMPQAQRDKIAAANTGRKHSEQTKRLISQQLQKYWAKLPVKPTTGGTNTPTTTQPIKPPTNGE